MESGDFKTTLEVALQFFPGIKLKRENRDCASKACLSNKKRSSSGFCRLGLVFQGYSSSNSEYWSENRALFIEGLRWTPLASLTQVLLAFGVTSVARSLASNRNWTTRMSVEGVCCRERLKLQVFRLCRVPYHPPIPLVTQRTFCSNSLFS